MWRLGVSSRAPALACLSSIGAERRLKLAPILSGVHALCVLHCASGDISLIPVHAVLGGLDLVATPELSDESGHHISSRKAGEPLHYIRRSSRGTASQASVIRTRDLRSWRCLAIGGVLTRAVSVTLRHGGAEAASGHRRPLADGANNPRTPECRAGCPAATRHRERRGARAPGPAPRHPPNSGRLPLQPPLRSALCAGAGQSPSARRQRPYASRLRNSTSPAISAIAAYPQNTAKPVHGENRAGSPWLGTVDQI